MPGPFIVAGSDGLAVRLAEELIAFGEQVVLLSRDIEPRLRAPLERAGVSVLDGDARDIDELRTAGLNTAQGLALVEDDDMGNLHAALAARGARAELRLVVRMFHQELGTRLEQLLPDARILSSSALAAPAFLAAGLQTAQQVRIADREFELRALTGEDDLDTAVPVAVFDPEQAAAALFPPAAPGVLALLPCQQAEADWGFIPSAEDLRQAASLVSSMLTRASAFLRLVDRRLMLMFVFVTLIVVTLAVVWTTNTSYDLLNSVYFAVTTVSTTGYGDITPLSQSTGLKLAVTAVMIVGATSLALVYALLTDAIVGIRFARARGERPHPRRDHVVVLGLGSVGRRVVEGLVARRIPCVAVERDEDATGVHAAHRLRVPVVLRDAAAPAALEGLHLQTARCLMAITDDDAANLSAALNALAVRDDLRVVLRLFDHDLAQRVEMAFSINVSRSLSSLSAPAFAAAVSGRRVLATLPVGPQAVSVAEISAPRNKTVRQMERAAGGKARVLSLGSRWSPAPGDRAEADDLLVAVGTPAGLVALAEA